MHNDTKHIANIKDFIMGTKWTVLDWSNQSPDLNQIEHAFYPPEEETEEETINQNRQIF